MKGQQGNNVPPTAAPNSGEGGGGGGGGEKKNTINSELWHACAGPLVTLPPVGSLVVYFPQGHSEQVAASMQKDVKAPIPNYPNLPSKLICLLHSVTLHADAETDEVYARMTLQPVNSHQKEALMASDYGVKSNNNKPQPDFFCKTLTASDTSTHGGFSVPRRAAEKIFPPLDFSMQPPVQELQARDLHANLWTFRHIYRGQPKRHLLTTGWSLFVSGKRLFAGDSILFIRDENSQLLLGIRRANRQPTNISSSVLSCDSMYIGILAAAAHAAANNSPFTIFYNPRASLSEFVIPLARYNKAIYSNQLSLGMRFRMMFETEESGTRRYMGTITGISDLDPVRWKNSQWCNLQVGWDESSVGERRNRVSLWEIEPVAAPFFICPPPFFRSKRPRQPGIPDEDSSDMENLFKRAMPWLGDDICIKDSHSQNAGGMLGLSLVQWMNMQQNPPLVIQNTQPDYFCPTSMASGSGLQNQSLQQNQFNGNCNNRPPLLPPPPPPPQPQPPQSPQEVQQFNQKLQASTLNQQIGIITRTQHQLPSINQTQNHQHLQSPPLVHHNLQPSQSIALQNHMLQLPLQQQQQQQYILQQQQLQQQLQQQQKQKQQQKQCQIPAPMTPQVNQELDIPQQHIQFQLLQKLKQQQQQQQSLMIQTPRHKVHENQQKTILESPQHLLNSNPALPQHHSIITQQRPSANVSMVGSSHISQSMQHPTLKTSQVLRNMTGELAGNLIMPPTSEVAQLTTFVNDILPPATNNGSSHSTAIMHNTDRVSSASMQILSPGNFDVLTSNSTMAIKEVQKPENHMKSSSMFIPKVEQIPGTFGTQMDHLESSNSGTSVCLSQTDVQMQHQPCLPVSPFNQSFLFRDTASLDEVQTADLRNNVLFGVNIDDSPLCVQTDNLLVKDIDSDKGFQNNIANDNLLAEANYNTTKEAQQEISSSIVSQSLGVPDAAAFNSIDSSLNDNCFLNKWSSKPPPLQRMRTYTKVYKRGAVGRSIDISRYSGYNELKQDLGRMFSIEGQIEDRQRIGWKLVYVDHENDVLLVGDDPWEEFVICVRCIRILSPQEVQQMSLDGDLGGNAAVSNQACSSSDGGNAWRNQQLDQNSGNLPCAGFYDHL